VTALAITGGQKLSHVLPVRLITRLAALVMVVLAGFTLVEALR
jgi:putative Ca2+/H+ antiporter (TMEM165/GDT1 family)